MRDFNLDARGDINSIPGEEKVLARKVVWDEKIEPRGEGGSPFGGFNISDFADFHIYFY